MFDNNKLADFLDETSKLIKDKKISDNQLRIVGEFYMASKFNENVDNINDLTEKEVVKFLFIGWYIYNMILITKKNEEITMIENDD